MTSVPREAAFDVDNVPVGYSKLTLAGLHAAFLLDCSDYNNCLVLR